MTAIPILCYHRVGTPDGMSEALFAAHLSVIARLGFHTVGLDRLQDMLTGRVPMERAVVLTFDDGLADSWTTIAPMLAAQSMTGTFFPVSDFVAEGGRRVRETTPAVTGHEAFKSALRGDCSGFLTSGEIRGLLDLGMDVQAHSARHQACFRSLKATGVLSPSSHFGGHMVYGQVVADGRPPVFEIGSAYAYNGFWPEPDGRSFRLRSDAERRAFCLEDFTRCRQRMEELTGRPCPVFCWPWGDFDGLATEVLAEAGFSAALTLERGANGPGQDPMRLRRIAVGNRKSAAWLASRLLLHSLVPSAGRPFRKKPEVRKVLYVTDSSKGSGGSLQLINNALAMAGAGLEAHVVCPPASQIASTLKHSPVRVHEFGGLRKYLATARCLRSLAAQEGIDVVHTFHGRSLKSALLARLLGARFKLFLNRGVVFRPNVLIPLWAVLADGIVCNSRKAREVLTSSLVPAGRVNVVLNSFTASFAADDAAPAASCAGAGTRPATGPVRVLYIGTSKPYKGVDVFLRAVARYLEISPEDGTRFAILGTDYKDEFARVVTAEVLARVDILGNVPHAEVLRRLAESDVFVNTSRQESMPNTLLEAFEAGLPAVCTAIGGVPDLIRDGVNGRLCPSEDADCLARAMLDLIRDPDGRCRMGRLNRRMVREFYTTRRKGLTLLRVYSGERLVETPPFDDFLS